jgi:ABC-type phosphate transport system auxiliary subunit
MIKVNLDIDVKNHNEIIREQKGSLIGYLSRLDKNTNQKVEDEIRKKLLEKLEDTLKDELLKYGIKAEVRVY